MVEFEYHFTIEKLSQCIVHSFNIAGKFEILKITRLLKKIKNFARVHSYNMEGIFEILNVTPIK